MCTDASSSVPKKLAFLRESLTDLYGESEIYGRKDRLHELIATILSHRTTHQDEKIAYNRMRDEIGDWFDIMNANTDQLTEKIQTSRYPEKKAVYIQDALRMIYEEREEMTIDFLEDMETQQALDWLLQLNGVGLKTATLLLLFSYQKPLLPVDTHVHRVMQRVGIIGEKTSAEKAHKQLLELLPSEAKILFNFHKHNYWHGQRVCYWKNPDCEKCVLNSICSYYAKKKDNL